MTDETVLIENLPDVRDINVLLEAMESIGVKVERITRHAVMMNSAQIGDVSVDYEYIKRIRASYYLIGALLGSIKRRSYRFREAAISAADRLIFISRASRRLAQRWRSAMDLFLQMQSICMEAISF